MVTLEQLTKDLSLNQINEIVAGDTTSVNGVNKSSGGKGLTWTTVRGGDGKEYSTFIWQ